MSMRSAVATLTLAFLSSFLTAGPMADLQPSTVDGIQVVEGFDASVFAANLQLPFGIALEAGGTIVVGSNCGVCPVVRLSPTGALLAASAPLIDPDGVGIDPLGRVLVAGDQRITLLGSLDGGADTVLAEGFINLNDMTISPSGVVLVYENNGLIFQLEPSGNVLEFAANPASGGLGFDTVTGQFLVAVQSPADEVVAIALDGTVTPISLLPVGSSPSDAESGPGGAFGQSIFVTLTATGEVVMVDRNTGDAVPFAGGMTQPTRLLFTSDEELLVADTTGGRILRFFPVVPDARTITFDIKPGNGCKCLSSKTRTVSAILFGESGMHVGDIDFESLELQGRTARRSGWKGKVKVYFLFANRDRYLDAVVQFDIDETFSDSGDGTVSMTGMMMDGSLIEGTSEICMKSKPPMKPHPPKHFPGRGHHRGHGRK